MITSNIKLELNTKLFEGVKDVIQEVKDDIGAEILKLIWKRTDEGFDVEGRQWRRYKAKNYVKIKRSYGATKWLQLTGNLRKRTKIRYAGTEKKARTVILKYDIVINQADEKKVQGLLSTTGYDRNRRTYPKSDFNFLGLSRPGSPFYTKELNRISMIIGAKLRSMKSSLQGNWRAG